jgi:hypothetical protein
VQPSPRKMAAIYNLLSLQNAPHLTLRFQSLADFVGKRCRPARPCRLLACPRCLQCKLDRDLGTITSRVPGGEGNRWVSLLLRVPGLVPADELEAEAAALDAVVKKFLRPSQLGISSSIWKLRARPVLRGGRTWFRLQVRLVVAITGDVDSPKLKRRWQRQLKSAGLKCRPRGMRPTVVVRLVKDLDAVARKLVGRVGFILDPVAKMRPREASAYLHVLAMRSDLVLSGTWDRCGSPVASCPPRRSPPALARRPGSSRSTAATSTSGLG